MQYINNFANADPTLTKGKLSNSDKLIIQKATTTINSWNSIVSNGVSITMANNSDIQYKLEGWQCKSNNNNNRPNYNNVQDIISLELNTILK